MKYSLFAMIWVFVLFSCASNETAPPLNVDGETIAAVSDRIVNVLFTDSREYNLAVLPFENDGSPNAMKLGHILQDEVISSIFRSQLANITLYERANLNKIIEEQKLSLSGVIENPVEIGKMISTRQVLIGSTSNDGSLIHITAKIVDVETGNIINSVSENLSIDQAKQTVSQAQDLFDDSEYGVKRLEFLIDWSPPAEDTVSRIILKDSLWSEYNSNGKLISQGNFELYEDRTFGVTWTFAISNAMIGTTTNYEYTYNHGIFVVRVIGKNKLIALIELYKM